MRRAALPVIMPVVLQADKSDEPDAVRAEGDAAREAGGAGAGAEAEDDADGKVKASVPAPRGPCGDA